MMIEIAGTIRVPMAPYKQAWDPGKGSFAKPKAANGAKSNITSVVPPARIAELPRPVPIGRELNIMFQLLSVNPLFPPDSRNDAQTTYTIGPTEIAASMARTAKQPALRRRRCRPTESKIGVREDIAV